ncbi:MAG: hypothetical protein O9325_05280 [Roseomonas sp.]|nr:hypothetical protein [Roseomonas sp.]
MVRPAVLLLTLLIAGCAAPVGTAPSAPDNARLAACQAEAERMVQRRERAQVMRADEAESSRGFVTVAPTGRAANDRGFAQMDRDRIIADCMRADPRAGGR